MPVDFKVPDLGENIESGDIVSVLVKEGDQVAAQQAVFEVETGKAVVELPTPHAGKITKVHVEKGSKVKVGDPLLTIETGSSGGTAAPDKAAPAAPAAAKPAAAASRTGRETGTPHASAARPRRLLMPSNENGGPPRTSGGAGPPPAGATDAQQKLAAAPARPRGVWHASWASTWARSTAPARPAESPKRTSRRRSAADNDRPRLRPPSRRDARHRCRPAPMIAILGDRFAARRWRRSARRSRSTWSGRPRRFRTSRISTMPTSPNWSGFAREDWPTMSTRASS